MKETRLASREYSQAPLGLVRDRALRGVSAWYGALILGAVLSLTVNVATRYCPVVRAETQAPEAAHSHSLDAERQHLLNDGLHWSAPTATFVLFEPRRVSSAELLRSSAGSRFYAGDCLYTQPPPSG